LISREMMRELIPLKSMQEFVKKLAKTDYAQSLKTAKTLQDVERGLADVFLRKLGALLKTSPEKEREFLRAYLKRYEVQNLACILRMKSGGASEEEVEALLMPTEILDGLKLKPILEAESLDSAKRLIERLGGYKLPSENADILFLEAELWRNYYDEAFRLITKIPVSDREDVKALLRLELELINLKTCALSIARGYDPALAQRFLIKVSGGVPARKFLRYLRKGDVRLLLEGFPVYETFLKRALDGEDWSMEVERVKLIKKFVDSKKTPKFISFFYVLKYFLDVEVEYRNLRAIAVSIGHNLPMELRKGLVILD